MAFPSKVVVGVTDTYVTYYDENGTGSSRPDKTGNAFSCQTFVRRAQGPARRPCEPMRSRTIPSQARRTPRLRAPRRRPQSPARPPSVLRRARRRRTARRLRRRPPRNPQTAPSRRNGSTPCLQPRRRRGEARYPPLRRARSARPVGERAFGPAKAPKRRPNAVGRGAQPKTIRQDRRLPGRRRAPRSEPATRRLRPSPDGPPSRAARAFDPRRRLSPKLAPPGGEACRTAPACRGPPRARGHPHPPSRQPLRPGRRRYPPPARPSASALIIRSPTWRRSPTTSRRRSSRAARRWPPICAPRQSGEIKATIADEIGEMVALDRPGRRILHGRSPAGVRGANRAVQAVRRPLGFDAAAPPRRTGAARRRARPPATSASPTPSGATIRISISSSRPTC